MSICLEIMQDGAPLAKCPRYISIILEVRPQNSFYKLMGWKTKISSEKEIGNIIYDILSEIENKKLEDSEDKKNELTEHLVELAKRNL
jgi:hypothetical protein